MIINERGYVTGWKNIKYRKHFVQNSDYWSSVIWSQKLTNASDGNLSIQLKKLESWEYVKSEKKLMNGKAVTQYEITEMGIQQFEEYVDFLESVIKGKGI